MLKRSWQQFLRKPVSLLLKNILALWFRITVIGHYQPRGQEVIIANSVSMIDLLLLAAFIPHRLTFVIHPHLKQKLWIKILVLYAEVIYWDSSQEHTQLTGRHVVLCPQDRAEKVISYAESAFIMQKLEITTIRPIRISGSEKSIFSLEKGKNPNQLFPKIILHIQESIELPKLDNQSLERRLFLLISEMVFKNYDKDRPLFLAMLQGARSARHITHFIEDSKRRPLTSSQFVTRCFILGRQLKTETTVNERVGLLMPTSVAGILSFFALQAYRRIPAMLNFSLGFNVLYSVCQSAGIKIIYTSREFVRAAKLEAIVNGLSEKKLRIRFLEDFALHIHSGHKLAGLIKGFFPKLSYWLIGDRVKSEQVAVILFTSGSESLPKGVALSHYNILANCYQMISRVDFTPNDLFFNPLPIFHCFGLTAAGILPLFTGNPCFLYPSPLHYKVIPELIRELQATIFFSTDTFLTGYARVAGQQDFQSLRYIFAGAEKLKSETMNYWQENFGIHIYEGYGATEASPVISLNCPMANKTGTVGLALPGMECRTEPVEGIAEGGQLKLRGPNIMLGYLAGDKSGRIDYRTVDWHSTGDIVSIDEEGFLTIIGRAKRFAKLGGEMVSLTLVESIASTLWPEQLHAAISRKYTGKGEKIVLFSENVDANKNSFIRHVQAHGYSELLVPYLILANTKIPVLASGKIDYLTLEGCSS